MKTLMIISGFKMIKKTNTFFLKIFYIFATC